MHARPDAKSSGHLACGTPGACRWPTGHAALNRGANAKGNMVTLGINYIKVPRLASARVLPMAGRKKQMIEAFTTTAGMFPRPAQTALEVWPGGGASSPRTERNSHRCSSLEVASCSATRGPIRHSAVSCAHRSALAPITSRSGRRAGALYGGLLGG